MALLELLCVLRALMISHGVFTSASLAFSLLVAFVSGGAG